MIDYYGDADAGLGEPGAQHFGGGIDDSDASGRHLKRTKHHWTQDEEDALARLIAIHGTETRAAWRAIGEAMPSRSTKQCREHWRNVVASDLKKGGWTAVEEFTLSREHSRVQTQWCRIAKLLPGRFHATMKAKTGNQRGRMLWLYVQGIKAGVSPPECFEACCAVWRVHGPPDAVAQCLGPNVHYNLQPPDVQQQMQAAAAAAADVLRINGPPLPHPGPQYRRQSSSRAAGAGAGRKTGGVRRKGSADSDEDDEGAGEEDDTLSGSSSGEVAMGRGGGVWGKQEEVNRRSAVCVDHPRGGITGDAGGVALTVEELMAQARAQLGALCADPAVPSPQAVLANSLQLSGLGEVMGSEPMHPLAAALTAMQMPPSSMSLPSAGGSLGGPPSSVGGGGQQPGSVGGLGLDMLSLLPGGAAGHLSPAGMGLQLLPGALGLMNGGTCAPLQFADGHHPALSTIRPITASDLQHTTQAGGAQAAGVELEVCARALSDTGAAGVTAMNLAALQAAMVSAPAGRMSTGAQHPPSPMRRSITTLDGRSVAAAGGEGVGFRRTSDGAALLGDGTHPAAKRQRSSIAGECLSGLASPLPHALQPTQQSTGGGSLASQPTSPLIKQEAVPPSPAQHITRNPSLLSAQMHDLTLSLAMHGAAAGTQLAPSVQVLPGGATVMLPADTPATNGLEGARQLPGAHARAATEHGSASGSMSAPHGVAPAPFSQLLPVGERGAGGLRPSGAAGMSDAGTAATGASGGGSKMDLDDTEMAAVMSLQQLGAEPVGAPPAPGSPGKPDSDNSGKRRRDGSHDTTDAQRPEAVAARQTHTAPGSPLQQRYGSLRNLAGDAQGRRVATVPSSPQQPHAPHDTHVMDNNAMRSFGSVVKVEQDAPHQQLLHHHQHQQLLAPMDLSNLPPDVPVIFTQPPRQPHASAVPAANRSTLSSLPEGVPSITVPMRGNRPVPLSNSEAGRQLTRGGTGSHSLDGKMNGSRGGSRSSADREHAYKVTLPPEGGLPHLPVPPSSTQDQPQHMKPLLSHQELLQQDAARQQKTQALLAQHAQRQAQTQQALAAQGHQAQLLKGTRPVQSLKQQQQLHDQQQLQHMQQHQQYQQHHHHQQQQQHHHKQHQQQQHQQQQQQQQQHQQLLLQAQMQAHGQGQGQQVLLLGPNGSAGVTAQQVGVTADGTPIMVLQPQQQPQTQKVIIINNAGEHQGYTYMASQQQQQQQIMHQLNASPVQAQTQHQSQMMQAQGQAPDLFGQQHLMGPAAGMQQVVNMGRVGGGGADGLAQNLGLNGLHTLPAGMTLANGQGLMLTGLGGFGGTQQGGIPVQSMAGGQQFVIQMMPQ